MKYVKVVGRQINGGWVLFKLPNGTAALVTPDGEVGFFYSWAQALRFTMIDARGADCVPADELRKAIEVLKQTKEDEPEYVAMTEKRKELSQHENGTKFLDDMEREHEEWCANAPTHKDGRLVWGYDDEDD